MTLGVGQSIVWASGLAFLGLGVAPPVPSGERCWTPGVTTSPGLVAGGHAGRRDRRARALGDRAGPLPPGNASGGSETVPRGPPWRSTRTTCCRSTTCVVGFRRRRGDNRDVVKGVSFGACGRALPGDRRRVRLGQERHRPHAGRAHRRHNRVSADRMELDGASLLAPRATATGGGCAASRSASSSRTRWSRWTSCGGRQARSPSRCGCTTGAIARRAASG